ncbi:MAG: fimbria/pilus outer membrane usher protein [Synechocystis sp.]
MVAKAWTYLGLTAISLGLGFGIHQPLIGQTPSPPPSAPAVKPQRVIVPVILNGREAGQVLLSIFPDGTVRFPGRTVIDAVATSAIAIIVSQLENVLDENGNLTIQDLINSGLEAQFDPGTLELQVTVPPDQRQTSTITLRGDNVPATAATALPPSTFSGFLNVEMIGDYAWLNSQGGFGDRPIYLNLETALNYNGWVLEGLGTLLGSQDSPFQRNYTGLVHDDRINNLRYYMGDFSLGGRGFQGSFLSGRGLQGGGEFLGVVVSRIAALQPYERTAPRGQFEFFLEQPSRVEVYVNNRLVNQLVLPAGTQQLQDLNLSTGVNDIYLLITDSTGTRRLDFSLPFDYDLLEVGRAQFAYGVGVTSGFTSTDRSYDFNEPTLILAHRQGITDTFTLGGFAQLDPKDQLLSFEGLWATDWGRVGGAIAYSQSHLFGGGLAGRFGYILPTNPNDPSNRSFNVAADFFSPTFTRPGQESLSNTYNYQLTVGYRQTLFHDLNMSLNGRYSFGSDVSAVGNLSLGLSKPIFENVGVGLSINKDFGQETNQRSGFGLGLNVSWTPSQGHQVRADTNTATGRSQLGWTQSSSGTGNNSSSFFNWQNDSTTDYFNGGWQTSTHRGQLSLGQDLRRDQMGGDINGGTRLRVETGIVFADGAWGIGPPVQDSFVIVAPHPALRDYDIEINPLGDGAQAYADWLGSGVLSNLTAYRVSQVRVDAPDLPLGADLGPASYNVLPSYKSGTLIRVGSDATVIIRGQLFDADKQAIALKTIEIVNRDDPTQTVTILTNRAGKFASEGFKPGNYEGRVIGNEALGFTFSIPPQQTGLYDLGEVIVTPAPR